MTEGITFNEIGTIDVTFDDKTYHLGRPKFRQFKYFSQLMENERTTARERLEELSNLAEDSEDAAKELAEFARDPFYNRTFPILAGMFEQVGDPLPSDPEDWPAWLAADSSLVGKILLHWQQAPKVSGPTPPI